MRKPSETISPEKRKATPDEWVHRLGLLLNTLAAMDDDERSASLKYAKQVFPREWPSDDY